MLIEKEEELYLPIKHNITFKQLKKRNNNDRPPEKAKAQQTL